MPNQFCSKCGHTVTSLAGTTGASMDCENPGGLASEHSPDCPVAAVLMGRAKSDAAPRSAPVPGAAVRELAAYQTGGPVAAAGAPPPHLLMQLATLVQQLTGRVESLEAAFSNFTAERSSVDARGL